jgi:hypothetical protein
MRLVLSVETSRILKSARTYSRLTRGTPAEQRNHLGRTPPGRKGKLDFVLRVVAPAESLFFRAIDIDDGFVPDPLFLRRNLCASRDGDLVGFPSYTYKA